MHASTVAILAIAVAAVPAFAQPVYIRQDASGAFKISAGDIKDGIDIGNSLIGAAGNLKQVITGHSRREVKELFSRAFEEELMARQDASGASVINSIKTAWHDGKSVFDAFRGTSTSNSLPIHRRQDESGAFKISTGDIKDGVDIVNGVVNAAGNLKHVITGHSRREVGELLTRALEEELMARQDDSGAFKIDTGMIKDGIDIGNGLINAAGNLKHVITGHSKRVHRVHRPHSRPAAHARPVVGPVSTLQRPQAPAPQAAANKRFFSLNELD
ncbi:hypothetical protein EUX98_g5701 [Antrodiella citrinella]|uniref:Uncharacterized protein n=1 Tax=Antrodiella citrinella TaxID=2447956 RepID=A0A4S4MR52_9APHY|nr:hypothetical protein EUX98_g5701 [Antrodiella citrinella]